MRTQIGTQITVEKKTGNLRAYPKTALDFFYEIQFIIFTSDSNITTWIRFIKACELAYREIDPKMIW